MRTVAAARTDTYLQLPRLRHWRLFGRVLSPTRLNCSQFPSPFSSSPIPSQP